ncbi:hypothetical protein KIL84_010531 [Mauremys mutica]|uniref:Uncharacterized protein n=1 Tax=Mauremys mutica TaxID=74926 RepID=A0A9D3X7Q2_9SAUR|nr:hypothetical protein KIL84_010531 [Mauremys mutica]
MRGYSLAWGESAGPSIRPQVRVTPGRGAGPGLGRRWRSSGCSAQGRCGPSGGLFPKHVASPAVPALGWRHPRLPEWHAGERGVNPGPAPACRRRVRAVPGGGGSSPSPPPPPRPRPRPPAPLQRVKRL